jgi:hypothetical protein
LVLEVTNAQDQLNLLKKIIDSTRAAISAEAAAEIAAKQQRAAAAAAKPRVRPAAKPISARAVKPTQATAAEKTAAAIVQRGDTQLQSQSLLPQPRHVYPSSTAKPKPIARLGKVAAVSN